MIGSEPMKRLALIILGCAMMFSCGDTFSEEYQKERLAARAAGSRVDAARGPMRIHPGRSVGRGIAVRAGRTGVSVSLPPARVIRFARRVPGERAAATLTKSLRRTSRKCPVEVAVPPAVDWPFSAGVR